ncbi:MAG TPA: S8 family serine peptidase [Candidatus Nanopelagicales bacterium]|nr:S8 family serine peptidase [Candidatus Nanopelagicales bacterium]
MAFRGFEQTPRDHRSWCTIVGFVASAAACATALALVGQGPRSTTTASSPAPVRSVTSGPAAPATVAAVTRSAANRTVSPVVPSTRTWRANADGDRVMDPLERAAAADPAARLAVRVSASAGTGAVLAAARAAGLRVVVRRATDDELALTVTGRDVAALGALSGVRMVESDPVVRMDPLEGDPSTTPSALLARYEAATSVAVDVRLLRKLESAGLITAAGVARADPSVTTTAQVPGPSEPDAVVFAKVFAAQGVLDADPGLADVRARLGVDGAGSVVAVVDTGIDDRNPALVGKVVQHVDLTTRDTSCGAGPQTTGAWDDQGHGTHVAGIIAGTGRLDATTSSPALAGVAPGASLVDLKVFDCRAAGSMSDVDAALQWVLDHGAAYHVSVVNLSLGASLADADGTDSTSRLVNQLQASGVHVVVAAGNTGDAPQTLGTPAVAEQATTVSAANAGPWGEYLASFASRGPTADGRDGVDLVAPGTSIRSAAAGLGGQAATGTAVKSGTSMAAPYVAGVYALLASMAGGPAAPSGALCAADDTTPACATGVVPGSMTDAGRALLGSTATRWFAGPVTGDGMVRASDALEAAAATGTTHEHPAALVLHATLSRTAPVTIAVDTAHAAAAVSVLLSTAASATDAPTVTPVDAQGRPQSSTCGRWTSATGNAAWSACDVPGATTVHGSAGYVEAGRGLSWVVVRTTSATPLAATLLVTGAASAVPQVSAAPTATAREGGAAGSVTLTRTTASDAASTWHVAGDSRVAPHADVILPAGAAGTAITVPVAVVDDSVAQGRNPVRVSLLPADGTEGVATVSMPAVDTDAGTPPLGRLLIDGAEPTTPLTVDAGYVVGGQVVGVARSAQLALAAGADPTRYSTPFTASTSDGTARLWNVGPGGGSPGAQVDVLDVSADGSRQLLGMWPQGSGVLPGDTDLSYELFVRDTATGDVTRVDPAPAARTAIVALGFEPTLVAQTAALSADGSTVAFLWPHSAADTSVVDLRLVDVASGASRTLTTLRTSVTQNGVAYTTRIALVAVTADHVDLDTTEPAITGSVTVPAVVRLPVDGSASTVLTLDGNGAAGLPAGGTTAESADGGTITWRTWTSSAVNVRDLGAGTTRTVAVASGSAASLGWLLQAPDAQGRAFAAVMDSDGARELGLVSTETSTLQSAWVDAQVLRDTAGGVGGLLTSDTTLAPGDTDGMDDLVWGSLDERAPLASPVKDGSPLAADRVVPRWLAVPGADHYDVAWTDTEGKHRAATQGTSLDLGSVAVRTDLSDLSVTAVSDAGVRSAALAVPVPLADGVQLDVGTTMTAGSLLAVTATSTSHRPVGLTVDGPCSLTASQVSSGGSTSMTASAAGTCTVTASVPETDSRLASAVSSSVTVTASTESITISAPITMQVAQSGQLALSATSMSGRVMNVTASGACSLAVSYLPPRLPMPIGTTGAPGRCTVTVWIPAAPGQSGARATATILVVDQLLVLAPATLAYSLSGVVTAASASGADVALSTTSGCALAAPGVASGGLTTVRALRGSGSCTVTATTVTDDGVTTTRATMFALVPATPSWRDVPRAAGAIALHRGRSLVLGLAAPRTTLGGYGTWSVARISGAATVCRVAAVSGRVVVRGVAAGRCRVTLVARARAGYTTALVRTWYVTVR